MRRLDCGSRARSFVRGEPGLSARRLRQQRGEVALHGGGGRWHGGGGAWHGGGGWNGGYGGYGGWGGGYGQDYGYGGVALGAGLLGAAAILGSPVPYYGSGYAYPQGGGGNSSASCESRFKSYNPATGTYLGYDGLRHPCPWISPNGEPLLMPLCGWRRGLTFCAGATAVRFRPRLHSGQCPWAAWAVRNRMSPGEASVKNLAACVLSPRLLAYARVVSVPSALKLSVRIRRPR